MEKWPVFSLLAAVSASSVLLCDRLRLVVKQMARSLFDPNTVGIQSGPPQQRPGQGDAATGPAKHFRPTTVVVDATNLA